MFLEYVALVILIFVALTLFYGVIVIHDIPYELAVKRNHPHQDAIHYAGWVSLFTLHVLWPFLWIWATLWREDRGWGIQQMQSDQIDLHKQVDQLTEQVALLHKEVESLQGATNSSPPSIDSDTDSGAPSSGENKHGGQE